MKHKFEILLILAILLIGGFHGVAYSQASSPIIVQVQGTPVAVEPTSQPKAEIIVGKPNDKDISGDLELVFTNNTEMGWADNPEILFSNGSQRLHFTIPAQTTQVQFDGGVDGSFQSGTVAGTITLNAILASGWQGDQPLPYNVMVRRAPAVITSVQIPSQMHMMFEILINGYSTTRSLNSVQFQFSPSAGNTVNNSFQTTDLANPAMMWFMSDDSKQVGGNFHLRVPFTFMGDLRAFGAVAVTLSNAEGMSNTGSASFTTIGGN